MNKDPIQNKAVRGAIAVVAILVGIYYWHHSIVYPSTDNAYVQANMVNLAPQITGRVDSVLVQNHQLVKAGDLLMTIDPKPFEVALAKAQAQLDLAKQQVAAKQAAVDSAQAVVVQRAAEYLNAQKDTARTFKLVKQGVFAKQMGDDAVAKLATSKATLDSAKAQLVQAQSELGAQGTDNADVRQAQAAVDQAKLDLGYTKIYAPTSGTVENFTLRVGDVVTTGGVLFALVDKSQWWVDANFKETQLKRIRPGQPAEITLDMYGDKAFKGKVESISVGSGSVFSLLPPENATGNWVKVTQRFPVRVKIIDTNNKHFPLRVGASATVTIDTH